MSHFMDYEREYIMTQRLGRLATVSEEGQPQNSPVSFSYNAERDTIDIRGHNLAESKKFRNIQQNPQVAFVVDDVLPPWKPRCVEIRGTAEVLGSGQDALIRIYPRQIISFGIVGDPYKPFNRKVGRAE